MTRPVAAVARMNKNITSISSDYVATPKWLRWLPAGMPVHRAMVTDLMRLHQSMPTVSQVKTINVESLQHARHAVPCRISWAVLFLRAFSLASQKYPSLRRTYLSWPWPHLYEHPHSVGNIVVSRRVNDEDWLFFAPFAESETWPLIQLQGLLERYQQGPVEEVFKNQVRFAYYPYWVRRFMWWLRFQFSPVKRIKRLGTFALTTLAGQGVTILDPRAPVTSTLTYGPIRDQGQVDVTIAYDHRVMDGKEIAEILTYVEHILRTQMVQELNELAATSKQPAQVA